MLTIVKTTFRNNSGIEKIEKPQLKLSKVENKYSIPSFSGIETYNDIMVENIKRAQFALSDAISNVFKSDRTLISDNFTGDVEEKDKFSKLGYYLNLKEKNNSQLSDYLQSQNLRKLAKEYNDFYNSNLKSYTDVSKGNKRFLNETLNKKLEQSNTDKIIEQKLDEFFIEKSKGNVDTINDFVYLDTKFAQNKILEFKSMLKENPLFMSEENIKKVFTVINKQLDNTNKTQYNSIYENFDNLSEALYTKDKALLLDSWKKLSVGAESFYKNEILKQIAKDKDLKVEKLNDFTESQNYKILKQNNNMSMLFEYRGSGEISLSEKAFLIDKYQQAQKDKKSYGIDMLDFLVTKPANNKIRKQIVKNLVESQGFAKENFDELKNSFITDINEKNYQSNLLNIKIDSKTIMENVLEEMNIDFYDMSSKNKVDYLSKIADEDLAVLIEKSRKNWMEEKFLESLNLESEKYDTSKQTENVLNKITIDVEGKAIGINEFLDDAIKNLYEKNADLNNLNTETLKQTLINKKLIVENTELGKKEYDCLMKQMISITQSLYNHDKNSEKLYQEISKTLDRIEMTNTNLKNDVRESRSFFQKIKAGILSPNNIIPAAASGNILYTSLIATGKATALGSCGEPHGLGAGAVMMLIGYTLMFANNIYKEFKKG